MGHQSKTGFCVGVRTRDQCHLLRQPQATPFRSTSTRRKASSVWKRNPSIKRGTMITYVSSDVWPYIEDAIYIDWNRRWRHCTRHTIETMHPWKSFPGSRWMTSIAWRPRSKRTCACTNSSNRMQQMISRPPNWSVDRYVRTPKQCISTFTRHIFHSSKMYACNATRIDVGSAVTRYRKTHGRDVDTSARVRGVCIESILVACTIRIHRCSNVWTKRTFVWLNRGATTRIEPPLTSTVVSTPNNFRRIVTRSTGSRVTSH